MDLNHSIIQKQVNQNRNRATVCISTDNTRQRVMELTALNTLITNEEQVCVINEQVCNHDITETKETGNNDLQIKSP